MRDDAAQAERERLAAAAAEEKVAREARDREHVRHPKLLELAVMCATERVASTGLYRQVGVEEKSGSGWVERFRPAGRGWVIQGAWEATVAVDESGDAWAVQLVQREGWWEASRRRTVGLPSRPRWSWVIRAPRHLTSEEAEEWALRGATGVVGGRVQDGVIAKSPEEAAREHEIDRTNR